MTETGDAQASPFLLRAKFRPQLSWEMATVPGPLQSPPRRSGGDQQLLLRADAVIRTDTAMPGRAWASNSPAAIFIATSITLLSALRRSPVARGSRATVPSLRLTNDERHRIEVILLCGQSINRKLQALVGVVLRLGPASLVVDNSDLVPCDAVNAVDAPPHLSFRRRGC